MHIPDGFLDPKTAITTGILSFSGLGWALRTMKHHSIQRKVPLIGLAAAFVFVAQMINFPVASGTSGHLLGATLIAVLLGPCSAIIVMSSVLIVQCLLFADGGILALGANIFNMAIVAPISGYGIYKLIRPILKDKRGQITAVAFASWCTIILSSIFCAGELAWSGTAPWNTAFPAMAGIHMLIGIGEAIITALVIAAISKTRPELLHENNYSGNENRSGGMPVYTMLVALGLLLFIVPFASPWPDGLERVAMTLGINHGSPSQPIIDSPLSEYKIPGISSLTIAAILAGVIGAAVVFGLSYILARMLVPTHSKKLESRKEQTYAP
jgi:cobalt/nickel transport system permease protein